MAIAHRASAVANSTTNTTSLTVTIPASVQANDVLFLVTSNGGATTNPTVTDNDSGGNAWARVGGENRSAGGFNTSGDVYWKRATSGTASKTITVSGCTNTCSAGVSAFSGVKTTGTPYENVTAEPNISGDKTNAGFTPTTGGSMVCLAVCNTYDDASVGSQSSTDPGTLTELFEHLNTAGHACGTNLSAASQVSAAATGTLTWNQTDKNTVSIGWNILPGGYELTADSGSYVITGSTATLTYMTGRAVIATSGSYEITGSTASLRYSSKWIVPDSGVYEITGSAATLSFAALPRPSATIITQANQDIIVNTASPQLTVPGRRLGA